MGFLREEDKRYLRQKFNSELEKDVVLLFFTKNIGCNYCADEEKLLKEVADLSDKIEVVVKNVVTDKAEAEKYEIHDAPALAILQKKEDGQLIDFGMRYFGIPAGYEFSAFIESVVLASTGRSGLNPDIEEQIKDIDKRIEILVFVTPTCPYCPRAVLTAHRFAVANPNIWGYMIEALEYPQWADRYHVHAVPKIVINDVVEFEGARSEEFFVKKIKEAAALTK
ncbi:MAG: glutaredoxin [Thermotogae bacterium]|nr:glutaredoxin [Thermotogota bacterium]